MIDLNEFLRWAKLQGQAHRSIAQMQDARLRPQIPTAPVAWLVVLGGVLHAGSLL